MKKLFFNSLVITLMFLNTSCVNDENTSISQGGNSSSPVWLIPQSQVRDGGPGKDGIPSIDNPKFASIPEIEFLDDNDLVLVMKVGADIKVYPHPILDWHEIINDDIGDKSVAITYCPLTGTAVGWNRIIEGKQTTFGVSGLLYNSNLIPYDRETDSNWSQMRLECVNGALIGKQVQTYQLLETSWITAKQMFPSAMVVTNQTGFSRNYNQYPYGSYRTDNNLIFPVDERDETLHPKERVIGIISNNNATLAYQFESFETPKVIQESFRGNSFLIVGSEPDNYMMAFETSLPGLTFSAYSDASDPSIVMEDSEGNRWNIFGEAVSGARKGMELKKARAFIGYWFSWVTFYPDIELVE